MSYHFSKTVNMSHDAAIEHVTSVLADHGFGVLTTIDVKAAMKKKIDKDIDPYTILGSCSPSHAYQAIMAEPHIGTMLPCNVIVRHTGENTCEISAIDPLASMMAIKNESLGEVATEVQGLVKQVMEAI